MLKSILLVEDTATLQQAYTMVLRGAGFQVAAVDDAATGLTSFQNADFDAVVLDLMLPDRDGLSLMGDLLALRPRTPVIVITSNGSMTKAVEAMRAGAYDFLVKPFDDRRLVTTLQTAIAAAQGGKSPAAVAPARPVARPSPEDLLGSSAAIAQVRDKIARAAPSMATVFLTGETGTGKELCAELIHALSVRAMGPFVAFHCAAVAPDHTDSALFGHLKGSFQGAIDDRTGALTLADGGTIFLDDIADLGPAAQARLLQFLQTSEIEPLGATTRQKINVRIICAMNGDPVEAVRQGRLREDLFYRLHVVPIQLPPLRDRDMDAAEIASVMIGKIAADEGRDFSAIEPEVARAFYAYGWPGNVRQLLNLLHQVVVMNRGQRVTRSMLPEDMMLPARPSLVADGGGHAAQSDPRLAALIGKTLADIERLVIEQTIRSVGGSVTRAAQTLDLAPSTLYRKLEAWQAGKPSTKK